MLLSARDQENRALHAGTQNGKSQLTKTPGQGPTKTPFAGKKNDENGAGMMALGGGKTAFKAHADAFMTPVGPRGRVPLGGKTTNIKAKQTIQFNDPLQQTIKPNKGPPSSTKQTTRSRRQTRLSVTPAKPITQDEDDEYPEIEYMPPAPKELSDDPDDYVRIDVGIIKQNLFKDVHSTPIYNAKRREEFERLTEYDEEEEESALKRRLEEILSEVRDENDKGQELWQDIFNDSFNKNSTVKQTKRSTTPGTRTFQSATKSSLARKEPTRPSSALSAKSGLSGGTNGTSTVRKVPAYMRQQQQQTIPLAKTVQKPRPHARTGLVPAITKHGDYHNAVGRRLGPIYRDEIAEAARKISSGECGVNDIDYEELEERALRESEKKISEKDKGIEEKMRELFRMDDEDDEVYQIPLDF
ncbi:hypothetical protein ABW20_dc0110290 [Dactylellina cionopaga]|nr:hypothetical protein ABW20_dc0110290 [Dactylellina cionopaga]